MTQSSVLSPQSSSSSSAWEAVVTAALVGTERQGFAVPVGEGALKALLARLDGVEPEAALLSAAATLALYGKAGWVPASDAAPGPEPAPPETQPRVSAQ